MPPQTMTDTLRSRRLRPGKGRPGENEAAEHFVDTSGWFPLVDPEDGAHAAMARALRAAVKGRRRIVTTKLVVAETHALIMRRIHRSVALAFVREVSLGPNIVVSSSLAFETVARSEWLERFDDQDLSFTDAVSFAGMKEGGIAAAVPLVH